MDERHAAIARENLVAAGAAERVEVIVGAGLDVLPELVKEVQSGARGKFNLVFIDADKENNWAYVDYALGMPSVLSLITWCVRECLLIQTRRIPGSWELGRL